MNFKTKISFGDDTRVWRTAEPTFSGLLAFVQGAWGQSLPNQWKLQYLDTDGDNVTITSEMDLADCVQTASENQTKGLKIVVSEAFPSRAPTVVATPRSTMVGLESGDDLEYEIVRGGSVASAPSLPEEARDLTVDIEQDREQSEALFDLGREPAAQDGPEAFDQGDEKAEGPEMEARAWAEERINAGRVPTAEQLEQNFKLDPLDSSRIIHELTPAIHDLLALQAANAPEPEEPSHNGPAPCAGEQRARSNSPSGMDADELKARLLSLGFNIAGSEEALRTAVRALSDPNIVVEATAYVEHPQREGPAGAAQNACGWRDVVKEFVEDEQAVEALTGPFVDVLYAAMMEGEDAMVAIQSAVAADEHLAETTLVKKLMPFLAGFADKINQKLAMIQLIGAEGFRNMLRLGLGAARAHLSGGDAPNGSAAVFSTFPWIKRMCTAFCEAHNVPEVRRDEEGRVVHMGVICDGCGMDPIAGPRFKSASRPDYDLCSGCERSRENPQDPMVKYAFPATTAGPRLPGLKEAMMQAKKGKCGGKWGKWGGKCGGGRWGKWGGGGGRSGRWGRWNNAQRQGQTPGGNQWQNFGQQMAQSFGGGPFNPNAFHNAMANMFSPNQGNGQAPGSGFRGQGNTMQQAGTDDNGVSQVECGEYKARDIKNVQEVIEARYGDLKPGPFASAVDVTDKVRGLVGADGVLRLTGVRSLNQRFGDPAVGVTKKLRVRYIKGAPKQVDDEVVTVVVDRRPMGFRYEGTRVSNVWNGGRAYAAGLRKGSTILMVNGQDATPHNITALYRSCPLPFEMVISRPVQAIPTKVKKLDNRIKQVHKQVHKVSNDLAKSARAAKKPEKEIKKHEKKVAQLQKQLDKQQRKLQKGKGGAKLPEKVEKTARQLENQSQKLEQRKAKHAEFVARLEAKKAKMQAKLKKMEGKLATMHDKRQSALEPEQAQEELEPHPSDSEEEVPAHEESSLQRVVRPVSEEPAEEPVHSIPDDCDEKEADPAPAAPVQTYLVEADHPYYEQNRALVAMGFVEEHTNIHVLAQCDGNIQNAIVQLVKM